MGENQPGKDACPGAGNGGSVAFQEGLAQLNAAHNRLPTPFRIRCGVSAGEVAIEAGTSLGHLQSSVIDRAAALQKQAAPGEIVISEELADHARAELGSLSRLPEPVASSPASAGAPTAGPGLCRRQASPTEPAKARA